MDLRLLSSLIGIQVQMADKGLIQVEKSTSIACKKFFESSIIHFNYFLLYLKMKVVISGYITFNYEYVMKKNE